MVFVLLEGRATGGWVDFIKDHFGETVPFFWPPIVSSKMNFKSGISSINLTSSQ